MFAKGGVAAFSRRSCHEDIALRTYEPHWVCNGGGCACPPPPNPPNPLSPTPFVGMHKLANSIYTHICILYIIIIFTYVLMLPRANSLCKQVRHAKWLREHCLQMGCAVPPPPQSPFNLSCENSICKRVFCLPAHVEEFEYIHPRQAWKIEVFLVHRGFPLQI